MNFLIRLLLAVVPIVALAAPAEVDHVVAVVNDEAITRVELDGKIASIERQFAEQNQQLPPRSVLQRQVLERMIVERAQLQHARESGLEVGESELDASMRRIAENNRLSVSDFRAALEKDGISWNSFREEIRDEMIIARLRDRDVNARVSVTDGEIDNYLSNVASGADPSVEVQVAHIVISVPEQVSAEQLAALRARADQVLARLKDGEDFARVAAAVSDSPDALKGGDLGMRPADRLPASLEF